MIEKTTVVRQGSGLGIDWRASVRDFLLALGIFAALFGFVGVDQGNAFPLLPPPELSAMSGSSGGELSAVQLATFNVKPPTFAKSIEDGRQTALVILALAMASLVAFNAAMLRHLRSAYTRQRQ